MPNHALRLERLNLDQNTADQITNALHVFLTDLGFSTDRISELECRSRDGFIPYTHNNGGLEAVAFTDQYIAHVMGTGFDNADATLEKYYHYDLEYFKQDNGLHEDHELTEKELEAFDEYRQNNSEATVLFSCDLMLTSETDLNIRLCVCVKDAPYHRQYDDLIDIDIEFNSASELKAKLNEVLKRQDVKCFGDNLN
jgi:hypothetical protein